MYNRLAVMVVRFLRGGGGTEEPGSVDHRLTTWNGYGTGHLKVEWKRDGIETWRDKRRAA